MLWLELINTHFNDKIINVQEGWMEYFFFSKGNCMQLICDVKVEKSNILANKSLDYQRLKKYDLITVGEQEMFIYLVSEASTFVKYYI
jgi:hypothetical protein